MTTSSQDGWKDMYDMPENIRILFIEGYCHVPWMETSYVRCPPLDGTDVRPFRSKEVFRVWCTDPSYLDESNVSPDAFGVKRAQDEIKSGRYHAIVLAFGDMMKDFVSAGGVVAFPSSEALPVYTLQKYFGVEWKAANYYRTTWSPCLEDNEKNINYSFGNGNLSRRVIKDYSAKGTTLRVPKHERCFGVSRKSRTQSLVPHMSGRDVSEKDEDGNYDVVVAMHEHGKGAIVYLGDVNAEEQTIWLTAAFIESRAPKLPIDCFSRIEDDTFTEITRLKKEGGELFNKGDLDGAMKSYESAMKLYGSKLGTNGQQRDCYMALLSNASLVAYKKGDYRLSETFATNVLEMEWGHEKCSYRRAMARLKICQSTPGGNLALLRQAEDDAYNAGSTPPGVFKAKQKLVSQIEAEIKRLKKKNQADFSSGFGKALSGKLN
jgi:hypothetical protein